MKIGQLPTLIFLASLSGCLLVGEKELFDPADDIPPEVVETFPADGASDVATGTEVRVWFSEPVDPLSVNVHNLLLSSGENLANGTLEVSTDADGRGLVVLMPFHSLIAGVQYSLSITSRITDLVGNPLPEDLLVRFRTAL